MSPWFVIPLICTLIIYFIYQFSKRKFDYWKKQNVPHLKPVPILGNFGEYILLRKYLGHVSQEICQSFPDAPYIGAYYGTEPALIVQSPELIKMVLTKDYYYFSNREVSNYTHKEIFTQGIFFTYGNRWKVIRQNMSPLFSSAKMRNMFHLIEKCSHVFEDLLEEETKGSNDTEVRSLFARYTMDCIGACAFGVDTNVMGKDVKNNPFRHMGELIFEISKARGFSTVARAIWPAIFYGLRLKSFPDELYTFFRSLLTDVFKSRHYEVSPRQDLVDLLLNLKKQDYITGDSLSKVKNQAGGKISMKVDDELLVSQCVTFFAAGYKTSAATLSFTLYEMAKNKQAQLRAQDEVDAFMQRHKGKLEYECVTELPFLEACIDEAMRLYPVVPLLTREVVEDYDLPTGVRLHKGVRVHVPVYHLHHNPEHFPEPEKYCPERFLPENKKDIKPYTYMPFGEGPRICIGMRFAKMQMLSGLLTILKKYTVELAPGMPSSVELEPKALKTQPVGGIMLKFSERSGWEGRLFNREGVKTC